MWNNRSHFRVKWIDCGHAVKAARTWGARCQRCPVCHAANVFPWTCGCGGVGLGPGDAFYILWVVNVIRFWVFYMPIWVQSHVFVYKWWLYLKCCFFIFLFASQLNSIWGLTHTHTHSHNTHTHSTTNNAHTFIQTTTCTPPHTLRHKHMNKYLHKHTGCVPLPCTWQYDLRLWSKGKPWWLGEVRNGERTRIWPICTRLSKTLRRAAARLRCTYILKSISACRYVVKLYCECVNNIGLLFHDFFFLLIYFVFLTRHV